LKTIRLTETETENKPGNKHEIRRDRIEQTEGKDRNKEKGNKMEEAKTGRGTDAVYIKD
jgi:hypothetical protein